MNIGIVGLGLIGGSFAKTIKKRTDYQVFAFDIDENAIHKAKLLGCMDDILTVDKLSICDYVIIALYPINTEKYIKENIKNFKKDAIIFDCAGVKEQLCTNLKSVVENSEITFIGGHPMAGREFSGFSYSRDTLFKDTTMILTPYSDCDIAKTAKLKEFILSLGFGSVLLSTPIEHDERIAYTSQLAHVVSNAYVKNPTAKNHNGFSAGSFKDLTRVAKLNEDMWTELFFENKENLIEEIDCVIKNLQKYSDALKYNQRETLKELLKEGRLIKESLSK